MKVRISIIIFFFLNAFSCKGPDDINKSPIDADFAIALERYKESAGGGWQNNLNGRFSWDDSYVLDGLVYVYKAEGKIAYLDKFIEIAEIIIRNKDTDLKFVDPFRGNKTLTGWGATRYTSDNSHHIFNVLDALILSSLTSFYNVVSISKLPEFYKEKARKYLLIVEQSFEEIQKQDFIHVNTKSGYFQDPYFTFLGMHTPLNQFARVGTLCVELFKATKNVTYYEYASKTAQYVKDNLIYKEDYLLWNYGYYSLNSNVQDYVDDVSHGTLVVEFMAKCSEMNIIFTNDDMVRLVNLFTKKIFKDDGFTFYLDGTGGILPDDEVYIHYFLLLTKYDRSIYDIISKWYNKQSYILDKGSFLNHFGEKLVLMNSLLRYYK